jgi:hypothetical protein
MNLNTIMLTVLQETNVVPEKMYTIGIEVELTISAQ